MVICKTDIESSLSADEVMRVVKGISLPKYRYLCDENYLDENRVFRGDIYGNTFLLYKCKTENLSNLRNNVVYAKGVVEDTENGSVVRMKVHVSWMLVFLLLYFIILLPVFREPFFIVSTVVFVLLFCVVANELKEKTVSIICNAIKYAECR